MSICLCLGNNLFYDIDRGLRYREHKNKYLYDMMNIKKKKRAAFSSSKALLSRKPISHL